MSVFDFFKSSKNKEERDAVKRREHSVARAEQKQDDDAEKEEARKTEAVDGGDATPHISEKATALGERGTYVFKVATKYNRVMVKQHITKKYKVTPRKVTIMNMPGKEIFVGRRRVHKPGFKKAIVFLKEGETLSV